MLRVVGKAILHTRADGRDLHQITAVSEGPGKPEGFLNLMRLMNHSKGTVVDGVAEERSYYRG